MAAVAPLALATLALEISDLWPRAGAGAPAGETAADPGHDPLAALPAPLRHLLRRADVELSSTEARLVHLARTLTGTGGGDGADPAPARVSLFAQLAASVGHAVPPRYLPLAPLALADACLFPTDQPPALAERRAAYGQLRDGLTRELEALPTTDLDALLETLYFLFQRYAWAVPASAATDQRDLSLFDRARTTCAIACALAREELSAADLAALEVGEPAAWHAPRLSLLGGDITGIQAFLYTITARGAARGLRGRSFYLQLVGEVVARWLLGQLQLPLTSLLYVGGGRFYLLTQHLSQSLLQSLRQQLDRVLLRCHQGDLYVALGAVSLSLADLQTGVGARWGALGEAINVQKRRKFAALPPEELHAAVFAPQGQGGPDSGCAVCRREGRYVSPADEARKCTLCASLEELGAQLRDARLLYLREVAPQLPPSQATDYATTLRALGWELHVLDDPSALRRPAPVAGRGTLLTLGSTVFLTADTLAAQRREPRLGLGFALLANVTPRAPDGHIAEFGTLARASTGVARLGILRMDVDDLGALFAEALGPRASLARLASLSFLLRLYFEGWVPELARRHNAATCGAGGADHVYAIYSGGDDLFLVGSWDRLPTLAAEIRRDLGRFAAGCPAVHVSAGIALVDEGFPLYQAAEHAGAALDRAKARQDTTGRVVKDAIDFLGQTLSWAEFEAVAQLQGELVARISADAVPRGLLHTLARFAALERSAAPSAAKRLRRPGPQVVYGRWLWLAAYNLTRLGERARGGDTRRWLEALRDSLVQPGRLQQAGLAARWAELLLRRERAI
jgi:CRISPR-associated protein Csm1